MACYKVNTTFIITIQKCKKKKRWVTSSTDIYFFLFTCECYMPNKISRLLVDILKNDGIKYLWKCLLQIHWHCTRTFITADIYWLICGALTDIGSPTQIVSCRMGYIKPAGSWIGTRYNVQNKELRLIRSFAFWSASVLYMQRKTMKMSISHDSQQHDTDSEDLASPRNVSLKFYHYKILGKSV
jgi:hypothetical protein